MATGATSGVDEPGQSHTRARYRTAEHGAHVVVVPTSCPNGHVLTNVGYRIYETGRTLHVSCQACTRATRPNYGWSLSTDGQQAAFAEFDDGPYAELLNGSVRR